jgi:Fe/S biogenesis protein NfuA
MPTDRTVLTSTGEATDTLLGIRAREPDAEDLALAIAVTGVRGVDFTYELTFIPIVDAADDDSLTYHNDLPILVLAASIGNLTGATIEMRDGGLAIDNPNSPVPKFEMEEATLERDLAEKVAAVLEHQINPAIAGHGGFAELASVEGDTVYLRLGGGCVGCQLAQATLSQGIEVAIKDALPEVANVVDVTDHASGTNPYYQGTEK